MKTKVAKDEFPRLDELHSLISQYYPNGIKGAPLLSRSFLPRHYLNQAKLNKKNWSNVHANIRKTNKRPFDLSTESALLNTPYARRAYLSEKPPVHAALRRRHRRELDSGKFNYVPAPLNFNRNTISGGRYAGPGLVPGSPGSPGPNSGVSTRSTVSGARRGRQNVARRRYPIGAVVPRIPEIVYPPLWHP